MSCPGNSQHNSLRAQNRSVAVAAQKQQLLLRWNEKAGLPAGCDTLPMDTHSRCKKETGHEEASIARVSRVRTAERRKSSRKNDKVDAQTLARLVRVDPELLRPIRHRGEKAQMALMQIRVRTALVEARTSLVNTPRGLAKSSGSG